MNHQMCENCGEYPEVEGFTIERGAFEGCWVCSKMCRKELLSADVPDDSEAREERNWG